MRWLKGTSVGRTPLQPDVGGAGARIDAAGILRGVRLRCAIELPNAGWQLQLRGWLVVVLLQNSGWWMR